MTAALKKKAADRGKSRQSSVGAAQDADLLVAIAAGDAQAFGEILRRFQDRVVNLVYRMVGNWDTALDLAQDAFLRIHRRAETFRPDGNAGSWILAVAVNLTRDYLRSGRNRILFLDRMEIASNDGSDGRGRSGPETPSEQLEREERRQLVHKVLAELPEFPRTMLLLRDFEGLSYQDISEILECEVGTVKSRIHRARKQFEELFERYL